MSGAEAIAVLGIISSIIAIVDGTKQVYDAASNAAGLPEAFREVAGRLPIVREILQCAGQRIRDGATDDQSCLAMKPLIDASERRAKSLESIFQKVVPGDDASRLERYFRATRTLGKGGKVETLMEGLMKDVLLLASEHGMGMATSRQIGELENAIKDISTLEPSIPDAAFEGTAFTNINVGNGPMTNNNVAGDQKSQVNYGSGKQFQAERQTFHMGDAPYSTQNYVARTQQFISTPAPPMKKEKLQETCEDGVLDQLEFDGMDERYEDIDEAHRQTFQWIYERPELNFVRWLKSGNGIFWITGKAGSGKSTLMKSIYEDQRTGDNLPRDIENRLIFSFFFHEKGVNPLLKSQEGLFRAILYKTLSKYRQLIAIAFPERYNRWERITLSGQHYPGTTKWSTKELRAGIRAIVGQSKVRLHLCLLIDGLDEFSGPGEAIVKTLAEFSPAVTSSHVRVQLCLSSRPLREFVKAYSNEMHLKVQDLTADDIKLYVTTRFNDDEQLLALLTEDPTTTNRIIEEILQKAEGVFLWVTLVIRSLIQSVDNGDDITVIHKRLSALEAGLVPLYKSMIGQIQSFYHREEAGKMFQMVHFAAQPLSPLAISFAQDNPRDALSVSILLNDTEIAKRHSDVTKQLRARTAGLIEIAPIKTGDHYAGLHSVRRPWKESRLQYMHLTVKEFLLSEDSPSWLADKISVSAADDAHLSIVACLLRQLRATGSCELYDYQDRQWGRDHQTAKLTREGVIFMILFHARQREQSTKTSMLAYLKPVDNLGPIWSSGPPAQGTRHWTASRDETWPEPAAWRSDFISFLIAIGMTYSVIDALKNPEYDPVAKPGRPLLLYATCTHAKNHNVIEFEKDTIDPIIVEELLKLGIEPNQPFGSGPSEFFYEPPKRTIWEATLIQLSERFSEIRKHAEDSSDANSDPEKRAAAMHDLRYRWLKTIELFLQYGANPKQTVTWYDYDLDRGKYVVSQRSSAPKIFNQVFSGYDHPLVTWIHDFMAKPPLLHGFANGFAKVRSVHSRVLSKLW